MLGASQIQHLKHEWIWEKTAATGFLNAKSAPLKAHENILVFCRQRQTYNPQMRHGAERKRVARHVADHGTNYQAASKHRDTYDSTDRYPRSVLLMPKDNRLTAGHPTQKPVALMEYMIRTYSKPGAVVLDNTMGSGTTGVACANTGRRFIGIERDEGYFNIAVERIREADEL